MSYQGIETYLLISSLPNISSSFEEWKPGSSEAILNKGPSVGKNPSAPRTAFFRHGSNFTSSCWLFCRLFDMSSRLHGISWIAIKWFANPGNVSNFALGPINDSTSKASLLNPFGSCITFTLNKLSQELYFNKWGVWGVFPVIQVRLSAPATLLKSR